MASSPRTKEATGATCGRGDRTVAVLSDTAAQTALFAPSPGDESPDIKAREDAPFNRHFDPEDGPLPTDGLNWQARQTDAAARTHTKQRKAGSHRDAVTWRKAPDYLPHRDTELSQQLSPRSAGLRPPGRSEVPRHVGPVTVLLLQSRRRRKRRKRRKGERPRTESSEKLGGRGDRMWVRREDGRRSALS
eukprot:198771-Hanusia_phi.AAC.1